MNKLNLVENNTVTVNQAVSANNIVMMSSKELTEVINQNKDHQKVTNDIRHDTVIRAIETMLKNLGHSTLQCHDKNQQLIVIPGVILKTDYRGYKEEYLLDKKHSMCLVAGYSTAIRMGVIERLEELEAQQKPAFAIPQSFAEALMLAGKLEAERAQLELENKEKEQLLIQQEEEHETFLDVFFDDNKAINIGTFAKITGVFGKIQMFEYLRNSGVMMQSNGNEPYQQYMKHFKICGIHKTPLLKCSSAKWLLNRMVKDNLISKSKKEWCYDEIKAKYSNDLDAVLAAAM
ncbi:phage antirepressor KilAC domain-containing protein [Atlantibacter subterraneus]|uniref:phage antirepressor KilAC domain-containing protein n=1 Tax=Atlantibacter subterraneus TaxID=255519 RepID=UPI0022EABA88|nr:phage antirepressor KilAC domain-containing protein [Atlantibacter subterranea]MDA3133444.1 phage antirepressor KilAC domain-containing protein [Atlantibacter subterranea]